MNSLRIDFSSDSGRNLQDILIQASSQEDEMEMRRIAEIILVALKWDKEEKIKEFLKTKPNENLEILKALIDQIGG
jgi:hypothetical protein